MAVQHPFTAMSIVLQPEHTGTDFYSKVKKLWPKGEYYYLMGTKAGCSDSSSSLPAWPSCLLIPVNLTQQLSVQSVKINILWFTPWDEAARLPSSSPLPQKPAKTSTHLKMKQCWRQRGVQKHRKFRFWALQLVPASVIDTFNKSAQQRCRLGKIHCGSVTVLLFRAYKSPRQLCFLPEGASQGSAPCTPCGTRKICFTLRLSLQRMAFTA